MNKLSKNYYWGSIRENSVAFLVRETATLFEVAPVSRKRRITYDGVAIWHREEAGLAREFLRGQALDDRLKENVTRVCSICAWRGHRKQVHASYGGRTYCSVKCYDTLFGKCLKCGTRSMDALINAAPNSQNPGWGGPENAMCSACHRERNGYGIACYSMTL